MRDIEDFVTEVLGARHTSQTTGSRVARWLKGLWSEMRDTSETIHSERECSLCEQPKPCALWWLPLVSQLAQFILPIVVLVATVRAAMGWDIENVDQEVRRARR